MKATILVCALLGLVAVCSSAPVPTTNCGSGSDHAKITEVDADPYPPVKGQSCTLTAAGTLDETLTDGGYNIVVVFFGIPLLNQSGGVCDLITCPVPAGPLKFTKSFDVPAIAPSGQYNITLSARDQNNNELFCQQAVVTISVPSDRASRLLDGSLPSNLGGPALSAVEELFVGLAEGLIDRSIPDILKCVRDADEVYNDFVSFAHHLHLDVSDVKQALRSLANGLSAFRDAMDDCHITEISEKVAEFVAKVDSVIGDIIIATEIVVDGIDIYEDLSDAVDSWESHNYKQCGMDIADAVLRIL